MIISPLVSDIYNQLGGYLHTPDMYIIQLGALSRSAVFMLVCLPTIACWQGSRRGLVLALGLGLWVAVGASALIAADFLPERMRLVHGLEIGADSFVHAWVLVKLLGKK
jgi:hypothetical protein